MRPRVELEVGGRELLVVGRGEVVAGGGGGTGALAVKAAHCVLGGRAGLNHDTIDTMVRWRWWRWLRCGVEVVIVVSILLPSVVVIRIIQDSVVVVIIIFTVIIFIVVL